VIQEKASFVFFTLLQLIDIRGVAEFFFKSVKLGEAFFLAIRSIFFCSAQIKGKEEGSRISPHWNRVVVVVVSLSLLLPLAYCCRWDFSCQPKMSFTFQLDSVKTLKKKNKEKTIHIFVRV
jgi:hypothetical protein